MIQSMEMVIDFDKRFERKKHYISPGGYIIEHNGAEYKFDFLETEILDTDSSSIRIIVKNPDLSEFPTTLSITSDILSRSRFTDFYIYTGEMDEQKIQPLRIRDVCCRFDNGVNVEIRAAQLSSVNSALEHKYKVRKSG